MIKKTIFSLMLGIIILTVLSCKEKSSQIVIKGSSSVLPIIMKVAEEYTKYNDISISVTGTGSSNGIKAIIDGNCDIANASRAMTPAELELAINNGVDIQETVICYDMVVPVVHPSNPVNNVDIIQLQAIYRGDISNWKQIGGMSQPITVVSRDSSSGTYHIWYKKVIVREDITPRALLQATNGAMVYAVAENPRSIGYISYGYLDKSVKALKINNINPTINNGKNGTYPISRRLYMYADKKKLKEETVRFMDFVVSKPGQKLIEEAGYIPL